MKKVVLSISALLALVVLVVFFLLSRPASYAPQAAGTASRAAKPPAPRMPFDPAALKPDQQVSRASISRLETRAAELREARKQLAVKVKSIDDRLKDPAQAANADSLREAKQALERSRQQMELEEKALAEFLLNEKKNPPSAP